MLQLMLLNTWSVHGFWDHKDVCQWKTWLRLYHGVVQLLAELSPTVSGAVRMCEERGGSLACEATFATDPLVIRADLIHSHETVSQYVTFRRKH